MHAEESSRSSISLSTHQCVRGQYGSTRGQQAGLGRISSKEDRVSRRNSNGAASDWSRALESASTLVVADLQSTSRRVVINHRAMSPSPFPAGTGILCRVSVTFSQCQRGVRAGVYYRASSGRPTGAPFSNEDNVLASA